MLGHYCPCGYHAPTLAGLRRHARKCGRADAKLRAAEDRARVERVERAKKINDATRAEWWQRLLGHPPPRHFLKRP